MAERKKKRGTGEVQQRRKKERSGKRQLMPKTIHAEKDNRNGRKR
jgi:hypothetical protein